MFPHTEYYPSLMLVNGYYSRSIPSFDVYRDVYNTRIAAKKRGDKDIANSYKLVLNTCYGSTLNKTNPLYDPLHARSVCISGQLYLLELAEHIYREVEGTVVTECNTDGLQIELDSEKLDEVRAIVHEWEHRTGFTMEEESISKSVSKDVNGYVQIIDGEVKVKGGMLVRGIATAGAFNVNNTAVAVATALREYLAYGTLPEDSIWSNDNILDFQFIAKASHKYSHVYHIVDGERVEVQRCNRVYATKDKRYGTLIKIHAEIGNDNKMAGLPEHCVVDNDNHLSIGDIDRQFYIDLAWTQITAFLGFDPRTKGGNGLNIHEKLLKAQMKFLRYGAEKTGKNMGLKYKFFQLEDIVPIAMPIFEEFGIVPEFSFTNTEAILSLVNVEDANDRVDFVSPMRELEPVVGQNGHEVANVMQRMGMVQTYQRRYLLMMALNIVESDDIDTGLMPNPPAVQQIPIVEKPKAEAVKTEVKKPVIDLAPKTEAKTDAPAEAVEEAGDIQKSQIVELAKKIIGSKAHPAYVKSVIKPLMAQTLNFKNISRADCEKYLKEFKEKLNG